MILPFDRYHSTIKKTMDYGIPKKVAFLLLSVFVLFLCPLFSGESGEKQVRVAVDRAPIHAESNASSYRMETLKKGTVLSVFEMGSENPEWLYVRYRSPRWRGVVTGFIRASMVEDITESEPPEKKPEPKIEKPPEKAPTKAPVKEAVIEPVVEEVLALSFPFFPRTFITFEAPDEQENPRLFVTAPTQKPLDEVPPRIEKPEAAPAEVKPKVENIEVTEVVGISLILAPGSYILPVYHNPEKPRYFLTVETKAAAAEHIAKQEKPLADVTKKMPEELQERQPPEVKTAETEAEKEQAVPQIKPEEPPKISKPAVPGKESLLTLSAGYGPSQGSTWGGVLQWNTKMGFAIHIGAGYYPTSYFYPEYDWAEDRTLYSVGIKYYLPFGKDNFRPYVDLQYGGLSVEAVRIVSGIHYYEYVYENIQKTLFGPTILAGLEMRFGSIGLNGAVGLSYNTTVWDYWERDYFLTAEMGLLLYLW